MWQVRAPIALPIRGNREPRFVAGQRPSSFSTSDLIIDGRGSTRCRLP
jgi:hypothetical protein